MNYLPGIFGLFLLVVSFNLDSAKGALEGPIVFLIGIILCASQALVGVVVLFRSRWAEGKTRVAPLFEGLWCLAVLCMAVPAYRAKLLEGVNAQPCPRHLSQIGIAILLYSKDHQGVYPPTLEALILKGDITAESFICPSSNDRAARGATTQEIASKIASGAHCSYHYFGAGFTSSTPSTAVVACDRIDNHQQSGVNMLFVDGHVEWIDHREASRILKEIQMGHNPPRDATTQSTVRD